ncbi:MAG TPA: hypothetical protein VNT99_00530 [Methylomirabilota bacterium]|nr:hypothetical protein [Methylomirabilota bacterium]
MNSSSPTAKSSSGLLVLVIGLLGVLGILFHKSFNPNFALFANDGPLGATLSRPFSMPGALSGVWNDNYWLGLYNGYYPLNFTGLFHLLARGMARVNFYAPMSALVLGVCAWIFFRRMGCNARASVLASLAAALNTNFMSNAAWGLPSRGLSLAAAFLALAAIEAGLVVRPILTTILAGLAIGLSITEGGDNGAIFSLFIAAYAFWRTWISIPSRGKAAAWGVGKVIVMAAFAAVMASETISVFFRVAVKGVAATAQDSQTKEQKWAAATAWSLPKIETLRLIIPGVFGDHMTPYAHSPESSYWGRVGEWPDDPKQQPRSSGAGEYAGVLVVLIALWGIVESLRRKGQIFTVAERKLIWFWAGMAVVGMFLGWGRHAPLYQLLYALPYFSSVRNPMKFFHAVHLCVMILFAYGLIGVNRRYLDVPGKAVSLFGQLKAWWAKAPPHEKLWTWGCIAAVGLGVMGWFGYMGSRSALVKHLMESGFPDSQLANSIASFSIREVLLFVLTLAVCVAVLTVIISGALGGHRAKWAALLLGGILVLDLGRADARWINYSNWKLKYATNPIIDLLKDKPYEHRVAVLPFQINQQMGMLQQYYYSEWLQHHLPYYGVQSLDMAQEPRPPVDKQMFRQALAKDTTRLWQLTNVRYLLGLAGPLVDMLNAQLDPVRKPFRQRTAFTLVRPENSEFATAETNAAGPFAVIEFTGALPRARLYNNWEIIPDEKALLARLGDTNWNPVQSVLLSQEAPKPAAPGAEPGKAEILSNPSPKLMEIQTTSDTPAMLLLNDKIDPEWHAYIDGKETPVLRANYLMRGVHVPAGTHKVVFKYEMKPTGFFIVLGCEIIGLLLVAVVIWSAKQKRAAGL